MKSGILILAAALMTGCAAQPVMPVVTTLPPAPEVASAALVFDAPITFDEAPVRIPRDTRGQAAFLSFDSSTTTTYDIFTDDRESTGRGNFFIRDSFSERAGITHR